MTDKIMCGGCGNPTFSVEHDGPTGGPRVGGEGAGGFAGWIVLTCTKCRSQTKVVPIPARMAVEGDDKGTACGGWSK